MFSMNIVNIDFFTSKPISHFDPIHSQLRNLVVQKVPIIRMFGNSLNGKKSCVFIHGVFPYLYIPFDDKPLNESILQQLATSIDKALNLALCYKDGVHHVHEIQVTQKKSMYGYHEKEQTFLKIFLYEPYHISKLEDLLLNGAIFNERFQPYESHIGYILQFCMDFNLYGMNYIKFNFIKFRNEHESSLPKLSYCVIEGDVKAADVIIELGPDSDLKNPGLRAIWKDEETRRRKLKRSSMITPQSSQTRYPNLYNTEKLFREKLGKNIKTYKRRQSRSSNSSLLSPFSSLDDTLIEDGMNCTLDHMILDQLNDLATDNIELNQDCGGGIDEDSILGTQIVINGAVIENEEPEAEDWTDQLELIENNDKSFTQFINNEESLLDLDTTMINSILDNTAVDQTEGKTSQDLFAELDSNNSKSQEHGQTSPNCQKLYSDLFGRDSSNSSFILNESIDCPNIIPRSESEKELISSRVESDELLNRSIFSTKTSPIEVKNVTLSGLIRPTCKPISKKQIVQELTQNEDYTLSTQPFYSDVKDIGKNELENEHLYLENGPVEILEEYKSEFCGLQNWREKVVTELTGDVTNTIEDVMKSYHTLFPFPVIIKPIKKPPSCKAIKRWLKCKEVLKKTEEKKTISKIEDNILDDIDSPHSSQKGIVKLDFFNEMEVSQLSHERGSNKSADDLKSVVVNVSPGSSQSKEKIRANRSSIDDIFVSSPSPDSIDISSNDSIQKDLLKSFLRKQLTTPKRKFSDSCAIDAMTPNTTGDFQMGLHNLNEVTATVENYYLTVLAVEIHAISRSTLKPDPSYDEVKAIFYYLYTCPPEESRKTGVVINGNLNRLSELNTKNISVDFVTNEKELFVTLIDMVRKWDPDILIGYEIETFSWGYLLERGYILDINLNHQLSRICEVEKSHQDEIKSTQLKISGRIIVNLWRLLRHEVALQSYTFENIMYHVLHERVPLYSFKVLTSWWEHRTQLYKWMIVEHYIIRVTGIIRLIEQLDLIGRTSELARLFGIQFYEVLSRGSQFRVESMMLRLARLNNFVALSPSVKQRAHMRAPESLPLILEPESQLYSDPVIVLDFQSLYPSVIIAYNYCFSTCLGRVDHIGVTDNYQFGCVNYNVSYDFLKTCENKLTISPAGVAFVDKSIRCGILPKMLQEILDTRLMVKQSMKEYKKDNAALQRVLHARQLGLKLIANVTYGYTAANFSGRMPCVEVGDSVVSKGRETLQKAIETVNNTRKWNCRVIYGDTDSLFVLVPGKTKKEAFELGKEIAEVVTNNNPTPVKLKFEKVYHPCILQTKKRYVGFMYESVDQEKPIYEAKGIETVRRDGCPAVTKILKKSLCILFETKDLSMVKKYVEKQFSKIISGRISVQDLTFAKEYRGMAGYKPGACVPALTLARRWITVDNRSEPRVGERVPYVITAGAPGLPLIKLVRSPHELLQDFSLRLNTEYYITRVIIPPLERCFMLLGTAILPWYTSLPRKQFIYLPNILEERKKRSTISQYFATVNCVSCNDFTQNKKGVCDICLSQPQVLAICLYDKIHSWQRCDGLVNSVCTSCVGRRINVECISLDCPVLYRKNQSRRDLQQLNYVLSLCDSHLDIF